MMDKRAFLITLLGLVLTLAERSLAAGDDNLEIEIDGIFSFAQGQRPDKYKVFLGTKFEKERDKRGSIPPAVLNFDGKLTFKARNKVEVIGTNATFEFQHVRKRRSTEEALGGGKPKAGFEVLGEFRFIDEHNKPRKLSVKSFLNYQLISDDFETYRTPEQEGTILSYEFKGKLTTIEKFGTEKFDTAIKLGVSIPPKPKKREVNVPETGAILQLEGKLVFRGSHPSGRVYTSEIALNGEVRYELLSDDKGRPSPSEEFKKGGEDSSDLIGVDGDLKVSEGEGPIITIPLKADFLTKSKVIGRDRTRRQLGKTSNPGMGLDFDGNIKFKSGRQRDETEQVKVKAHLRFWEISSTRNSA